MKKNFFVEQIVSVLEQAEVQIRSEQIRRS